MTTLLGANNAGKSNVLAAIAFALTPSDKPAIEDFFAGAEADPELWVEVQFTELSEQEARTFQRYVGASGDLRVRKSAALKDGKCEIRYSGYTTEPREWWLRSSAWSILGSRQAVTSHVADVPQLADLANGTGRLTKAELESWQQAYINANRATLVLETRLEDGPFLGERNVAGGLLPDFFLVPAVRDLSEETKARGTALLARLLQKMIHDVAGREGRLGEIERQLQEVVAAINSRDPAFDGAPTGIERLERTLERELSRWNVSVSIQVDAPSVDRLFELGTRVVVDDGHATLAERKGHGLQRAIVFALLRTWADALNVADSDDHLVARRASSSVIFAVEEPELYLHPHAQRDLASVLVKLSQTPGRQVLVSTHSPAFVDIANYQGIARVCKKDAATGTTIEQCQADLFGPGDSDDRRRFQLAGWLNPDRSELFFARRVVLVEGETEERLFPALASKLGLAGSDTSVIDCGSKFNLVVYVELLNGFRIPYLVVHDEDPMPDPIPDGWSEDRVKQSRKTYKENERIRGAVDMSLGSVEVLCPHFEGLSGVSRRSGEKMGKAMAAMAWLDGLTAEAIPSRLREVTCAAFQLDSAEPRTGSETS